MAFSIHYKRLCEVRILHEYFLGSGDTEFVTRPSVDQEQAMARYDLSTELTVVPTSETERVMAGLGIRFRATRSGFFVAARAREEGAGFAMAKPPGRGGFVLRFLLLTRSERLVNYTAMPLVSEPNTSFWFSNRPTPGRAAFPDLTARPAVFRAGDVYRSGDMVRRNSGAGTYFVALRDGTLAAPVPNSNFWRALTGRGYASGQDRVRLRPERYAIALPTGVTGTPVLKVFTMMGAEVPGARISASVAERLAAIDLSGIPHGRYNVQTTGTAAGQPFEQNEAVFIDGVLPALSPFGIVEIGFYPGDAGSDFGLFGPAPFFLIRNPQYTIRLLNRITYWRYSFRSAPTPGTPLGDLEVFNDRFITRKPHGLSRGYTPVLFDDDRLLPNPVPDRLVPSDGRVFSDVYVHN